MCGILGFSVLNDSFNVSGKLLLESVDGLTHRGPDAAGAIGIRMNGLLDQKIVTSEDYNFGLGHTRLSILDLSSKGNQPFSDEWNNWIVYNGEIYNYLELKRELHQRGHLFHTDTDTEVILAAYREFGLSCVEHFNGMWAFALYDSCKGQIFCSRDRLGVKPFYYIFQPGMFAFASEIRSLLHLTEIKPVVLRVRLAGALVHGVVDSPEQTLYKNVMQLPSGHSAVLNLSEHDWQIKRYWNLPYEEDLNLSDEDAIDQYAELIEDAVKIRLRADVPVALTLSGGIDSSVIALALSRTHSDVIPVFTSQFPNRMEIDETRYALEVAKVCGLDSQLVEPDLSLLMRDEHLLCQHQELPFGSLSLYVHWAIIERIRQQDIKVILSGQGGDELFLGYERYFAAKVLSSLPNIPNALQDFLACARNSKLGIGGMAAYQIYFTFDQLQTMRRTKRLSAAFNPEILAALTPVSRKVPVNIKDLQKNELLGEQLAHLLRYDDRTTGAHGMETRLPFLDYRMVEFAYRLPWRFKIRNGWSKWLSRAYLSRYGLKTAAWRKNKLSFNAPTNDWVRSLWEKHGNELASSDIGKQLLNKRFNIRKPSVTSLFPLFGLDKCRL